MGPTVARNAADAAFDGWLRTSLHAHYGAVAAAPVPHDLIRLVQPRQATGWAVAAVPSRSREAEGIAPARGLAVGLLLSGLFWAGLAVVAQTLWA